jgi:ketosteroid isomerase-like protein
MSAEAENTALVRKFYDLMSSLELEKMIALLDEEYEWTLAGTPEKFKAAGKLSRAERTKELLGFTSLFKSLRIDVLSSTAQDDRVAVETRATGVAHNGAEYRNEYLILLTCRNGKIKRVYQHCDLNKVMTFIDDLKGRDANRP